MALDAIKFTKDGKMLDDYKRFCRNQPRGLKGSYSDRMEILEFLVGEKIITNKNGLLALSLDAAYDCFYEGLAAGYEDAWEFVDLIGKSEIAEKKFDNTENLENGLEGEKFIITELEKNLSRQKSDKIIHVSLIDDTKGYDIEFENINNQKRFLEVKTSSLPAKTFSFYLSRNEYEVGMMNDNVWSIVLVKLLNGTPVFFGSLSIHDLVGYLPEEKFKDIAKWQVLKFVYDGQRVNYSENFSEFISNQ